MNRYARIQMTIPFSNVVKWLVIINVCVWLVLQIIIEKNFFPGMITYFFGLVPARMLDSFFIWQPFTYMFLHSTSQMTHLLFNMLMLWMMGAELELRWGSRFFLLYYFVTGVGAALIYVLAVSIYALFTGDSMVMSIPVIGASGAIFGLIVAYGIIFGERIVYFMMIFPMKAKFFVMLLGFVELMVLFSTGVAGSGVANLAHLGGLISGFLFLIYYTHRQTRRLRKDGGGSSRPRKSNLRLVVNNDSKPPEDNNEPPRYWH